MIIFNLTTWVIMLREERMLGGWADELALKNTCYSCKGSRFSSTSSVQNHSSTSSKKSKSLFCLLSSMDTKHVPGSYMYMYARHSYT